MARFNLHIVFADGSKHHLFKVEIPYCETVEDVAARLNTDPKFVPLSDGRVINLSHIQSMQVEVLPNETP